MIDYQLVVPMTGTGQRFKSAGYHEMKPLIEVNGQSFFEHVVDMFPGADDILFILSSDEPQKNDLIRRIIQRYPHSRIVEIASHKFGPSYALLEASHLISETKKIIVSYCDFHATWNPSEMLDQLATKDGSILTYTGFHPHMARNNKYAYVKKDGELVTEIQEKNPFSESPMDEEASAGCYGFASKHILVSAIEEQIKSNLSFDGEFYTSLTYLPILNRNGKIGTVLAREFSQWGTPEDLADWQYWNRCSNHEVSTCQDCAVTSKLEMTSIILAAGAGKRIEKHAKTSKPNILVGSIRLWEYSRNLAKCGSVILVTRKEIGIDASGEIKVLEIEGMTQGQAISARLGLANIENLDKNPVHVFSSDNVMCAGATDLAMKEIIKADLVVWTVSGYPPAQFSPEQYSWLILDGRETVLGVIAKSTPPNLNVAHLIIGNFTFKNSAIAKELIEHLEVYDIRINNEFYLDSVIEVAIQKELDVSYIEVDRFFAVGTEQEIKTYNYYSKKSGDSGDS
jgi:NDP-sugar pyrophosphorylase family protein